MTNPPFVISPATGERLVYRDSGLPGDRVVEHIVRGVPDLLREGGTAQVLGNWMVMRDQPWEERLSAWIQDCDAWVVQREVVDLPSYVELWLKDAGTARVARSTTSATTPGCPGSRSRGPRPSGSAGSTCARPVGRSGPSLRLEEWPYDIEQPIGPEVAAFFERTAAVGELGDEALLASRLVARADLRQETYGAPGAEDPEEIVLRQQLGMRRARQVDTVEAALVGACDGELTPGPDPRGPGPAARAGRA